MNWKSPIVFLTSFVISTAAKAQELNTFKLVDKLVAESTWYILGSLFVVLVVLIVFTGSLIRYGPAIRELAASSKLYTIFKASENARELFIRVEGIHDSFQKVSSRLEDNLNNVERQNKELSNFRDLATELRNSTDQLMERLGALEGTLALVIEVSEQAGSRIDNDPAIRIKNAWNILTTEIDAFISRIPDANFQRHMSTRDRRNRNEFFKIFVDHEIFSEGDKGQLDHFIGLHNRTRGRMARDQLTADNAKDAETIQVELASKLDQFDTNVLKLPDSSPVKDEHDASI